ncbi:MAG: hypothetical protein SFY66_06220 [Oculatellaceae cyanobacterium bins.114]|nr:hypothetical protein [Oculatellaceae cyanobacterium bins.114]
MKQTQSSDQPMFFTVYASANCLELCAGCEDRSDWVAIHTSKSYEMAYEFAQNAAKHRGIEFRDCSNEYTNW